jgi:hypothetical protein
MHYWQSSTTGDDALLTIALLRGTIMHLLVRHLQ